MSKLPLTMLFCLATTYLAQAQTPTVRDSVGIHLVTYAAAAMASGPVRRLAPSPAVVLGTGRTPDDQFAAATGAIRLSDGSILVADGMSTELKLFDATGKFVRKLGQKGEGPGDFRQIGEIFALPGDTILVWDGILSRLTRFTVDGKVAGTQAVDRLPSVPSPGGRGTSTPVMFAFAVLGDGALLGFHGRVRSNALTELRTDSIAVAHVTTEGKYLALGSFLRGETYVFHSDETGMTSSDARPFTTAASVAAGKSSLWYTDGRHFELREYSLTGKLVRVVRLRREPTPVSNEAIEAYREGMRNEMRTMPVRDSAVRARRVAHNESVLRWLTFPKAKPAWMSLLVARTGDIWARQYGDATQVQRWEVFDSDARFRGWVDVPAGLAVFEIGREYLLGQAKDRDDVETVRLYRFIK